MICFLAFSYNFSDFCYKNFRSCQLLCLASPWINITAEHPKTQSSRRKQGLCWMVIAAKILPSIYKELTFEIFLLSVDKKLKWDLLAGVASPLCCQTQPPTSSSNTGWNNFSIIVQFFDSCQVRLFLSLPPGWLRCQHQCERQRQSDTLALCCQVNIDPPDDQLLSSLSLSTLICNPYRFKISAGGSESKNVKTGLVSTYISDQSIKRVLDISETLWLNHNRMSWRKHLRK